ncbi:MAG: hypothetical protein EBZ07_06775 [Verrucomicrobia bacterium]|nr:hypothetical protein [Verrucomicrobiota bacterium]
MMLEPTHQLIEVKVQNLQQIFNSIDPSPFHERDLDPEAEEFIVSWAQEHNLKRPFKLVVHLGQTTDRAEAERILQGAIRNYFNYRYEFNQRELKQLLRYGWTSLLIALGFLAACVTAAQAINPELGRFKAIVREGLVIIGWVAMWRPLDIYLYRWWPRYRLSKIYHRLSTMPVEIRAA